jgi:hypothetical protein
MTRPSWCLPIDTNPVVCTFDDDGAAVWRGHLSELRARRAELVYGPCHCWSSVEVLPGHAEPLNGYTL